MSALIRLFWDICTFRRGPQDTPYSSALFGILLMINLAYGYVSFLIPDGKGGSPSATVILPFLLVHTVLTLGMVYLVLWMHGRAARSVQTITAMLGADMLIGFARLPFLFLAAQTGEQVNLLVMLYLGFMVTIGWELAVHTHIFRHALSTTIFRGGAYALLLFALSLVIHYQMLPVAS